MPPVPFRLAAVACLLFAVLASPASAERNFTKRFGTNDLGDITIAANTLLTCPSSCPEANQTSGTASTLNNNAQNMVRVDVDADAATFDSSIATLNLPAGASVLWAGLYWS